MLCADQLTLQVTSTPRVSYLSAAGLDYEAMVATRLKHESKFSAAAVRQRGRQMASSNPPVTTGAEEESFTDFRRRVIQRLEVLLPAEDGGQESMTGVVRQVRHTGVPILPSSQSTGSRKMNKIALRNMQATVSTSIITTSLNKSAHCSNHSAFTKLVRLPSTIFGTYILRASRLISLLSTRSSPTDLSLHCIRIEVLY